VNQMSRTCEADSVSGAFGDAPVLAQIAQTLRATLDGADLGHWSWDIASGEHPSWDARCKALFGLDAEIRIDRARWHDAIVDGDRVAAAAELARALDPNDPNDNYACEYEVLSPSGRILMLAAVGRATFTADTTCGGGRRAIRIDGTFRDITQARQAEQKRQQADAMLRAIIEASHGLIYVKDRSGRMLLANKPVMAVIGKPWQDVEGKTDQEFLDDSTQAAAVMAADRQVMETGEVKVFEEVVSDDQGDVRIWQSTKTPMRDAGGQIIGLVGMSVEITERRRLEERLGRLLDEVNHRVKNALTTVLTIASHTLRGTDLQAHGVLEARLMALASAHDLLARESWSGAWLHEVVESLLRHHPLMRKGRVQVSGPALRVKPRAVLALAMGLHELAANAERHGALSDDEGRVEIAWSVDPDALARFRLTWTERDGKAVAVPFRRGIGTRLIERSLSQDLGGTAAIEFLPTGVFCLVDAPLSEVDAATEAVMFPKISSLRGH
jgi:PAS domain S-box-containing protein